jgi:hypothetical protein
MLDFFSLDISILDGAFAAEMWDLTTFFTVDKNIQ